MKRGYSEERMFDDFIDDFRDATLLSEPIDDDLNHLCSQAYGKGWSGAIEAMRLRVESLRRGPGVAPSASGDYDAGWLACCDAIKKELDRQR